MPWRRGRAGILRLSTRSAGSCTDQPSRLEIFFYQIVDSAIFGGIAGFSAFAAAGEDAGLKVFILSFATVFLIKLKEYRKLKD